MLYLAYASLEEYADGLVLKDSDFLMRNVGVGGENGRHHIVTYQLAGGSENDANISRYVCNIP